VVIEATVGTCQGSVAVFRGIIARVRPEAKFGNGRASGAGPHRHYAAQRIGTIERTLRTPQELHAVGFGQRESTEINGSSRLGYADAVDNDLVVVRIAAAHKE